MANRHHANLDTYINCARGHRHNFDDAVIPNSRKAPWGTMLTERCNNCGTVLERIFDLNGNVLSRRYLHEADYRTFLDDYSDYTGADWNKLYFKVLERKGLKATVNGTKKKSPPSSTNVVPIRSATAS